MQQRINENKYIKTTSAVTAGVMMISSAAIGGDMITVMDWL